MQEHIFSIKTYSLVFAGVLALTLLTTLLAFIDLGPFNVVVALAIAATKATLVFLFFMNGLHSPRLSGVIVIAALVWLGILLSLTAGDYLTRGWLPYPGK